MLRDILYAEKIVGRLKERALRYGDVKTGTHLGIAHRLVLYIYGEVVCGNLQHWQEREQGLGPRPLRKNEKVTFSPSSKSARRSPKKDILNVNKSYHK